MKRFLIFIFLLSGTLAVNAQDSSIVKSSNFQIKKSIIYYQGDYGILVEVEDILNNHDLFKRRLFRKIEKLNGTDDLIVLNDYIKETGETAFTKSLFKKAQSGDLMVLNLKTNKVLPALLLLQYNRTYSYQIVDPEKRIVILDCKYQYRDRFLGCPSF